MSTARLRAVRVARVMAAVAVAAMVLGAVVAVAPAASAQSLPRGVCDPDAVPADPDCETVPRGPSRVPAPEDRSRPEPDVEGTIDPESVEPESRDPEPEDRDAPSEEPDSSDTDDTPEGSEGTEGSDEGSEGLPLWLLLVVAVASAAAGALVVLLIRRPAPPSGPSGPPPSAPPPVAPAGPSSDQDRQALVRAAIEVRDLVPSEALRDRLAQALRDAGVEEVRADGEPFDPARHVAVDRVPAAAPGDHNRVAATERPGYVDRGSVVRLPEVVVSRQDETP